VNNRQTAIGEALVREYRCLTPHRMSSIEPAGRAEGADSCAATIKICSRPVAALLQFHFAHYRNATRARWLAAA